MIQRLLKQRLCNQELLKPEVAVPSVTTAVPVTEPETVQPESANYTSSSEIPPIRDIDDGDTFVRDVGTAGDDGPATAIQPATPGVLVAGLKDTETAKSSSIENDGNGSKVKMRNAPPKRTSTPTSLSSQPGGTNIQSILAAIWHTVFVSWIGGFITKLCGGRRRP